MNYFVTAIGTDSGKTLFSSILCEALEADYWKPIQAGLPKDSDVVRGNISNKKSFIHPEAYLLNTPASPHASAAADGLTISLDNITIPNTKNHLVIEGAGGCLVPLNNNDFVIDLAKRWQLKTILVSNIYLGSINHTLLSYEALMTREINVIGFVFNGKSNKSTEEIILHHTKLPCLLHIDQENKIDRLKISNYAAALLKSNML